MIRESYIYLSAAIMLFRFFVGLSVDLLAPSESIYLCYNWFSVFVSSKVQLLNRFQDVLRGTFHLSPRFFQSNFFQQFVQLFLEFRIRL